MVLLPPLLAWFRLYHEHLDRIPARGPAIVACNHISYLDPLTNAEAVHRADADRASSRSTISSGSRWWARCSAGRVRSRSRAGTRDRSSLDRAAAALERGEVVVVYPEGTVTKRPDGLPMDGKTGTVRLSLRTGVPITPMASWGSQAVWQKSGRAR